MQQGRLLAADWAKGLEINQVFRFRVTFQIRSALRAQGHNPDKGSREKEVLLVGRESRPVKLWEKLSSPGRL